MLMLVQLTDVQKKIWEYLWIKMDVQITDGNQPVGRWIWACLQTREALRILQQYKTRSEDLENKAIFLASKILVLCGAVNSMSNAKKLVKAQLENWEAWKKMQEIIKAQNWEPNIKSEDIQLGKFSHDVIADKDCIITKVDMKHLNTMVRWLWAPKEYQAWIYLHKKLWDKVKKWEIIYTMYSNSANKLDLIKQMQKEKDFYTYQFSTRIKEKIKNVIKKLT
jgi:AMP phosphorylase